MESIAALTKLASIRAAGLVLDEIAVNTSMLQDIESKRRIPAVGKVMAGSMLIKLAVIPAALLMTAFVPGLILPLVTFGGLHLAAEGVRHMKEAEEELGIVAKDKDKDKGKTPEQLAKEKKDLEKDTIKKDLEKDTIKKVLVIDGLLSVEITIMTLPLLVGVPPLPTAAVLAMTGAIRTSWMYSLIGSIINMPRMGEWLKKREGKNPLVKAARGLGTAMTKVNPYIVKSFEVAGTLALLMIGGGLLIHGVPGVAPLMNAGIGALTSNHLVVSLLERVADLAVGFGIGSVARVPLDKLYEGIGKGVKAVFKPVIGLFKGKKKPAPANDNPAPKKAPEANAAPALQSAPDVKVAMNTAAVKPVETAPVVAPAQPEQPKVVPPKANP